MLAVFWEAEMLNLMSLFKISLVDEIFSQPQDSLSFAAHSAVFMPI